MERFRQVMEIVGIGVDALGVFVVVAGVFVAAGNYLRYRPPAVESPYRMFRQDIGRAILLGLEFLVAGDIIRTVVVDPTLQNVLVLAVIVLIRTFLSMSLQVELEGRWPWQTGNPSR